MCLLRQLCASPHGGRGGHFIGPEFFPNDGTVPPFGKNSQIIPSKKIEGVPYKEMVTSVMVGVKELGWEYFPNLHQNVFWVTVRRQIFMLSSVIICINRNKTKDYYVFFWENLVCQLSWAWSPHGKRVCPNWATYWNICRHQHLNGWWIKSWIVLENKCSDK